MRIAVTGAFGYSGRYIAKRLLEAGHGVITLTNSVQRKNPFGDAVVAHPFHFDQPNKLVQSLRGADTLVNTYWVRFDHRLFAHDQAVTNTKVIFNAAKEAGVRRIIHVSITNPDLNWDLSYFRGKAELEQALMTLGLSYCILRPTVLFGKEDVLINNIAWVLRGLPVFGVFGSGDYKLQPIYVDDLAAAAVEKAAGIGNEVINAIGPETFTYRELVTTIGQILGCKRAIISVLIANRGNRTVSCSANAVWSASPGKPQTRAHLGATLSARHGCARTSRADIFERPAWRQDRSSSPTFTAASGGSPSMR